MQHQSRPPTSSQSPPAVVRTTMIKGRPVYDYLTSLATKEATTCPVAMTLVLSDGSQSSHLGEDARPASPL